MEDEERADVSGRARLFGRGCGGGSRIRRLEPEDASVLRSEVVIADVGDIVYELVANAIDAAATEVRNVFKKKALGGALLRSGINRPNRCERGCSAGFFCLPLPLLSRV